MATLAAWTGAEVGDGFRSPEHAVIDFFTHHLGLVEPVPYVLVAAHRDRMGLQSAVRATLDGVLSRQSYTHYGVAVLAQEGGLMAIVTLSSRRVTLEEMPRQVGMSPMPVRGSLAPGFASPVFVITDPEGRTSRVPAGDGPEFDISLAMEGNGRHRVELLANGPGGVVVVANAPFYLGVEPPMEIMLEDESGPGEARDATRVADALLELINASRAELSLAPVERMSALDAVALAHSVDMQTNEFIAHDSPTTGSVSARVTGAGIQSGLILENIGRGYGAREIHRGLMESPGHRANVLNPQVTHVGVGVESEQDHGRLAFIATQVFIRTNRVIDAQSGAQQLLDAINAGRQARGAEPLEMEPNLQSAAQEAADAYFADPQLSQQDAVDGASASMRRFAIAFRRVGGLMTVVGDLSDAERLEPTFDPEVSYIGLGVAQGSRPDSPPNSIGVVIMLGWPR